ncbi:MAG: MarR family winged helix-turn-helix transcriptional regulator [Candidatus Saccharibacteria bacterium]|nr:MarR family winged helix-turn-helix transcriptional regulator [Candidatus Saccharibacteria bacterium]
MKVDKRSALKQGQIDILETLYKYRFGSRQLLADSLGIKSSSNLFEKLNVLMKHGFVARRYDKSFKLRGVPAAYYLTPKGLRRLQLIHGSERVTDAIIKASYRDKVVGQSFVDHVVEVYVHANRLQHKHPPLKVFLRREMALYSYFPANPPDAFLSLKTNDGLRRFFFDVVSKDMPPSAINRRLVNYMEFFDDGGWDATGSDLPKLLFLLENPATENRLRRTAHAVRSRFDLDDEIEIYTATIESLLGDNSAIWSNIDELGELLSLDEL